MSKIEDLVKSLGALSDAELKRLKDAVDAESEKRKRPAGPGSVQTSFSRDE